MYKKHILILLPIVLITEIAALIGCTNKPGPIPTINSTPWENVVVSSDPNVAMQTLVDQPFSLVISFPMIPEVNFWESSVPDAFTLLESKEYQPPSKSGTYKMAYLFKALKVGKYQIRFGTRDKLNQIHNTTTFNIEVTELHLVYLR